MVISRFIYITPYIYFGGEIRYHILVRFDNMLKYVKFSNMFESETNMSILQKEDIF